MAQQATAKVGEVITGTIKRCVFHSEQSGYAVFTVWGIVERYYPDAHTGEMVWAIRKANDLTGPGGPVLQPGQELWMPDPMMYGVGRP